MRGSISVRSRELRSSSLSSTNRWFAGGTISSISSRHRPKLAPAAVPIGMRRRQGEIPPARVAIEFVSAGESVERQQYPEQQRARDGHGQERRNQLGECQPYGLRVRSLGDDQLDVDDQFVQQQREQEDAGPEEYAGGDEPDDVAAEETHGGPPGL